MTTGNTSGSTSTTPNTATSPPSESTGTSRSDSTLGIGLGVGLGVGLGLIAIAIFTFMFFRYRRQTSRGYASFGGPAGHSSYTYDPKVYYSQVTHLNGNHLEVHLRSPNELDSGYNREPTELA